jgi:hypothetical protein
MVQNWSALLGIVQWLENGGTKTSADLQKFELKQ